MVVLLLGAVVRVVVLVAATAGGACTVEVLLCVVVDTPCADSVLTPVVAGGTEAGHSNHANRAPTSTSAPIPR
jgi:hypothetical protein